MHACESQVINDHMTSLGRSKVRWALGTFTAVKCDAPRHESSIGWEHYPLACLLGEIETICSKATMGERITDALSQDLAKYQLRRLIAYSIALDLK